MWLFNRIVVENEDYKTTFILKKINRGDTGIYTVTAKNSSGTDTAEVEICVLSTYIKNTIFIFKNTLCKNKKP